ncbi:MAG: hypothetical protein R8G66_31275 [Cytophagales bacterium]|nr:hypothetical protein [Cytophagales bacterium]
MAVKSEEELRTIIVSEDHVLLAKHAAKWELEQRSIIVNTHLPDEEKAIEHANAYQEQILQDKIASNRSRKYHADRLLWGSITVVLMAIFLLINSFIKGSWLEEIFYFLFLIVIGLLGTLYAFSVINRRLYNRIIVFLKGKKKG